VIAAYKDLCHKYEAFAEVAPPFAKKKPLLLVSLGADLLGFAWPLASGRAKFKKSTSREPFAKKNFAIEQHMAKSKRKLKARPPP